jgi:hypothetical protein
VYFKTYAFFVLYLDEILLIGAFYMLILFFYYFLFS